MKRLIILVLNVMIASLAVFPALAQDNSAADIITLNDATPSIDVVITMPPDTTGVVSLNLSLAAVRMTDQHGNIVFEAADARIHVLELNIAPNTGSHTLLVERLPNTPEAYVKIVSLPELTNTGAVPAVTTSTLALNEGYTLPITSAVPGGNIAFNIPDQSKGVITASFPGVKATAQIEDAQGSVLVTSSGDIDGVNIVLDGGAYKATILANSITEDTRAGLQLVPAEGSTFVLLPAPTDPAPVAAAETIACKAVVSAATANLRSGPGTGYSVLNYTYRGESLPVGGINPENNWVVVGTSDGASAWLSRDIVQLEGSCNTLTVFNIPLRNAQPASIQVVPSNASTQGREDHEDHDDHDDDDDHGEHDDDDD